MPGPNGSTDTPRTTSLKAQINRDVFGLFGTYLMGITSLSMLVAMVGIHSFQQEEFTHYQALISTRLSAEIHSALQQNTALSQSTDVWTGLRDPSRRGTYLAALFAQANQTPHQQFNLLDERGHPLLRTPSPPQGRHTAPHHIQQTLQDSQTHLELVHTQQSDWLSISTPITADYTDSAIGIVLLSLDLGHLKSALKVPPDMQVQFQLTPFSVEKVNLSQHHENFVVEWRDAGKPHALHIQLQQSYVSAFLFVMTGLLAALASGGLLFIGLKRWTRLFSERTTLRLENLVLLATNTVQGHAGPACVDTSGDEISKVSNALHNMLHKQQLATQKLMVFSRVFETAAEAILITDRQGLVIDVNTALTDMTGYTKEELLNQPAGRLYIQDHALLDVQVIAHTVRQWGAWRGETYFLNKQQALLPVLLSVSALLDAQGTSQGHVSVFSDIRAIREAEKKLKDLLCEDPLTGLPNYRGFLEHIHTKADTARFALLFIDLDHFKNINDTFGHDQGDEVLRQMAQHLQTKLPAGNFLCRRSGDEFIAVLDVQVPLQAFQCVFRRT